MTNETTLQEAIGLVREGRKTEARWLLEDLLRVDRANETAWLWYADCVETVDERMLALQRCLRHNPNARRARAGLDLLRSPRAARAGQERPPVIHTRAAVPSVFLEDAPAPLKTASNAVLIDEPAVQDQPAAQKERVAQPAAQDTPLALAEPIEQQAADESAPAFELTPEDEWLLSDGAGVFTVSPDALSPEELEEMAARTEAFLNETRSAFQPARRRRKPQEWQELEQTTGSRAPGKRRKTAQAVEASLSRAAYTTITALAVVILVVIALGAAIVLRGV